MNASFGLVSSVHRDNLPQLDGSLTTRLGIARRNGIHLAHLERDRSLSGKGGADGGLVDERVYDGLRDNLGNMGGGGAFPIS